MAKKEKDKSKKPETVENRVHDIRRVTRKKYTVEDKITYYCQVLVSLKIAPASKTHRRAISSGG